MNKWITWLYDNRNWVFPGVGVAIISGIFGLFDPSGNSRDINVTASGEGSNTIITNGPATINQRDPLVGEAIDGLKQELVAKENQLSDFQEREFLLHKHIKELTEAITAIPKQTDLPNANTRIKEALMAAAEGNSKLAEAIFEEIKQRKIAEGKIANKQAAEAARYQGALAYLNDTQKALNAYQQAVELDPDDAEGWNRLGYLLGRVGQLRDAEVAYIKIRSLGEATNDQNLLADSYNGLGGVNVIRGDLDQAEMMFKKSLSFYKDLGSKEGKALINTNLGNVYRMRGDLDQAIEKHQKSLSFYKDLGSKEGMGNNYTFLGNVHGIRGDLDQAVAMYKKALPLFEDLGIKEGEASIYTNMGNVYGIRGDLDQAEAMYQKGLPLYKDLGSKEGMANIYTNWGNVYRLRGDLDKAKSMYLESLRLYREIEAQRQIKQVQSLLDSLNM